MDHGGKEADDMWIKRKFLKAILHFDRQTSQVIRQRLDSTSISSTEVLNEFISMGILSTTADNALARAHGTKKPSLALKAKTVLASQEREEEDEDDGFPEDTKYAFNEHMDLASRKFWGNKKNFKSNSSSFKPKDQRIRTCFNCGNVSHFMADCPYEKREDHGGNLIQKDKTKSPLNKNFVKKKPQ